MLSFLNKNRELFSSLTLVIYCLVILILPTVLPDNIFLSNPVDKFMHFIAYGLLSFILFFTIYFQDKFSFAKKYPALTTLIIVSLFGLIDEIQQLFLFNRTANILDWFANLAGSILTLLLIKATLYLVLAKNN